MSNIPNSLNYEATRRQKVLHLLLMHRLKDRPYLLHRSVIPENNVYISGGFLPIWEFTNKYVGGSSGDRRLRELRMINLVPIEMHRHRWKHWNPAKGCDSFMTTPIYRIGLTPEQIEAYDWSKAFGKSRWIFYQSKVTRIEL